MTAPDEIRPFAGPTAVPALPEAPALPWRRRLQLKPKLLLFLALALATITAISGTVTAGSVESSLHAEFQSKGEAIARSLANSTIGLLLTRDASTIQSLVDQFADIQGVAYALVYDPHKEILAHTFSPFVPPGLLTKNDVPGSLPSKIEHIAITDPASGARREILDIGVPVLAGQLGTVRVGMDLDLIAAQARRSALVLVATLAALALVVFGAGSLLAGRFVQPVYNLVGITQRVGRGDLSRLAPVTSGDEIGFLAQTFNDAIIRLRDLVETEEDRDKERRQREELQASIARFLRVTTEIAQGDLTRRGEVSGDVLGSVVDSINVMVEEIGEILAGVRRTAEGVSSGAREMIASTEKMVAGARSQAEDALRVDAEVEEVTESVRGVSASATASAEAARETLEASRQGRAAVDDTLAGMQRIRAEVQVIARQIKELGERSMEISEIVDTISGIASQTNLLALNAAIEAAGAGDEGARFGVVADEVRKLAEGSAKAARRIAGLIKHLQSGIQEAVVAMEAGTGEVENGFRLAQQAGERLRQISELSNLSADLAQRISAGAQQQVEGVERVGKGVSSIAFATMGIERSVSDGRDIANQLSSLAQDLDERLARFKLN